jgi:hypothetical protein
VVNITPNPNLPVISSLKTIAIVEFNFIIIIISRPPFEKYPLVQIRIELSPYLTSLFNPLHKTGITNSLTMPSVYTLGLRAKFLIFSITIPISIVIASDIASAIAIAIASASAVYNLNSVKIKITSLSSLQYLASAGTLLVKAREATCEATVLNSKTSRFCLYPNIVEINLHKHPFKLGVFLIIHPFKLEGFLIIKILALRVSLNKVFSPELEKAYPNIIPVSPLGGGPFVQVLLLLNKDKDKDKDKDNYQYNYKDKDKDKYTPPGGLGPPGKSKYIFKYTDTYPDPDKYNSKYPHLLPSGKSKDKDKDKDKNNIIIIYKNKNRYSQSRVFIYGGGSYFCFLNLNITKGKTNFIILVQIFFNLTLWFSLELRPEESKARIVFFLEAELFQKIQIFLGIGLISEIHTESRVKIIIIVIKLRDIIKILIPILNKKPLTYSGG